MKEMNVFNFKGYTEEDNKTILDYYYDDIEMYVDEYDRVLTANGAYIADAYEVEPGEGIGC